MANDPAALALTVILFGLAGLLLIGSVPMWLRLGKGRERIDEAPTIPVHALRSAATVTALAFGLLGLGLLWAVFVRLG